MTVASNIASIQGESFAPEEIPRFEGNEVVGTKAKVISVAGLEIGDQVFRMDETVRMVVEARVEGINHVVNPDGKLVRVHTLKALDSIVIDWKLDLGTLRDGLK